MVVEKYGPQRTTKQELELKVHEVERSPPTKVELRIKSGSTKVSSTKMVELEVKEETPSKD